jgi:hypothetical protein
MKFFKLISNTILIMAFLMNHDGNSLDGYSDKITNRIQNILTENIAEATHSYMEERDVEADSIMTKIVDELGKTTGDVINMVPLLSRTSLSDKEAKAEAKKAKAEAKKAKEKAKIEDEYEYDDEGEYEYEYEDEGEYEDAQEDAPEPPLVGTGIIEDEYEDAINDLDALKLRHKKTTTKVNELKVKINTYKNGSKKMKPLDKIAKPAQEKRLEQIDEWESEIEDYERINESVMTTILDLEETIATMPREEVLLPARRAKSLGNYIDEDAIDLGVADHELQKKYNSLSEKYNENLQKIKDLEEEIVEIEENITDNYINQGIKTYEPVNYGDAIQYNEILAEYNDLIKQHTIYKDQRDELVYELGMLQNNIEELEIELEVYESEQEEKNTPEAIQMEERARYENPISKAEFDWTPIEYGKVRFASDSNFVLYNTHINTVVTRLKSVNKYFVQLFKNNIGYIEPENMTEYKEKYKEFNDAIMTLIDIIRSNGVEVFEIARYGDKQEALEFLRKMHEILHDNVKKLEDNTNKLLDSYNYRSDKIRKKKSNSENKIISSKQPSSLLRVEEEE